MKVSQMKELNYYNKLVQDVLTMASDANEKELSSKVDECLDSIKRTCRLIIDTCNESKDDIEEDTRATRISRLKARNK